MLYKNESERLKYDWYFSAKEYLAIGIYYIHIREWLKYYPKEQILVTKFEENIKDAKKFENIVLDFLEVENKTIRKEHIPYKQHATRTKTKMPDKTRGLLEEFYRPHNKALAKLLNDDKYLW